MKAEAKTSKAPPGGEVHAPPRVGVRPALMTSDANIIYRRVGLTRRRTGDSYHRLISSSWPRLLALLVVAYLTANALFALAYLAVGDAISNARPGSFADAFFFSVQTMATIGYGVMAPRSLGAHVLVVIEVLVGLVGLAVVTGITFAKFSRATARVLFSKVALITMRDGVPCFTFRMANERGSSLVEAQAHVVFSRDELTATGEMLRRFYDLPLTRQQNILFALSWTVIHPITPESPLFGATLESLSNSASAIIVSVFGLEENLGQTVHARHAYNAADIRWSGRFADILCVTPEGERVIDYRWFHDIVDEASETTR